MKQLKIKLPLSNHGKTKRAWGQKRNVYFKYIFLNTYD